MSIQVSHSVKVTDPNGGEQTVSTAFANASSSGANQVVAGVANKRIRVVSYQVGPANGAVNVYFQGTSAALTSTKYLAANGGFGRVRNEAGYFETAVGEPLQINLSGAVGVGVDVEYYSY
jgi:hypothetical protein